MFMCARVYAVAICSNSARNVALGLKVVSHHCCMASWPHLQLLPDRHVVCMIMELVGNCSFNPH